MANAQPHKLDTISAFHAFRELPRPEHPLISVINYDAMKRLRDDEPKAIVNNFYTISLKRSLNAKMKYGQQEYDFDEGVMLFMAPGQVFSIAAKGELVHSGWGLFFHPDFLWNTALAQKIKQFNYFSYDVHEALFLSDKEEANIIDIFKNIQQEYHQNIDSFSQDVIIAQLDLLLTYAQRFYQRQFITRKIYSHKILQRLEALLNNYFADDNLLQQGIPTVSFVAGQLNISPGYLSETLKTLTGQGTQQHIHDKLIEKAKEKLAGNALTVSEVAYALGFEHTQSFSKFFKAKTAVTPLAFRQSFN